ncbi:TetR/AcrR family transcriptional regulator [Candidatus Binatia bacterium]|nr:TetR/AcrR family transcriptional regulator [Candidatus Binatia bacterium]
MPRVLPAGRLEQLVDCAARVFVEQGYRRTQMADVADALGVAKGTLYLYVESKEALFDFVARYADAERPFRNPPALPVPSPEPGATLEYVRQRLAENRTLAALSTALARQRVTDVRGEVEAIVGEMYETMARNRHGLRLLDRAAPDMPDLAALWFEGARGGLIAVLDQYLQDRIRRGKIRAVPDTAVAARLIIETVVFWAVHRKWDPHPQAVEEDVAKRTVVQVLRDALVKE